MHGENFLTQLQPPKTECFLTLLLYYSLFDHLIDTPYFNTTMC